LRFFVFPGRRLFKELTSRKEFLETVWFRKYQSGLLTAKSHLFVGNGSLPDADPWNNHSCGLDSIPTMQAHQPPTPLDKTSSPENGFSCAPVSAGRSVRKKKAVGGWKE
jgi:hypothetical protein